MARDETVLWTQSVDRKKLVNALSLVYVCVAEDKTRVDDYKCFKFRDGSVNTFDGTQGMSADCEVTFDFLVFATRFYNYLKALDTEQVTLSRKKHSIFVNGDAEFPMPIDDDFPVLLKDDLHPVMLDCARVAEALRSVLFCVDKKAAKLGVPPGVLFREEFVYASNTQRSARSRLSSHVYKPFFLPLDGAKAIIKLGDPTAILTNKNDVAVFYDEGGVGYVARQLTGTPEIATAIDARLCEAYSEETWEVPGKDAVQALRRLSKCSAAKTSPVRVVFEDDKLTFSVEDKVTGAKATESVEWGEGPKPFSFKCNLDYLVDGLSKYDYLDLHGLPMSIRFDGCIRDQDTALDNYVVFLDV